MSKLDRTTEALRKRLLRKQFYLIHMRPPVPMAEPLKELAPRLKEHLEWLKDLEARGVLFASGPIRDETGAWDGSGMAVIRARSLAAAKRVAAGEPFHRAGIRRNRVEGWQVNEGSYTVTVRYMDNSFEIA
jgi:hypothetical protein